MTNLDAANGNESGIFRRSDTRLAFRRLRISSLRDDDPEGEEQQGYRGSAREQNGWILFGGALEKTARLAAVAQPAPGVNSRW